MVAISLLALLLSLPGAVLAAIQVYDRIKRGPSDRTE